LPSGHHVRLAHLNGGYNRVVHEDTIWLVSLMATLVWCKVELVVSIAIEHQSETVQ